jgi:hypothetical protein
MGLFDTNNPDRGPVVRDFRALRFGKRWRFYWAPVEKNGVAIQRDETKYEMRDDGWRRIHA